MIMSQGVSRSAPEVPPPAAIFEHLAAEGAFEQPAWLLPVRRAAMAEFTRQGFPTIEQEDWRFTNLEPLVALPFRPVAHRDAQGLSDIDVKPWLIPGLEGPQLVFVDGYFAEELSQLRPEPGVTVGSLAAGMSAGHPVLREHLGRLSREEENPFVALNTAFLQDGAFVRLEPEVKASPIHLIHVRRARQEGWVSHTRHLIVAGRRSSCSVIETHVTVGGEAVVTNTLAEVFAEDAATVEHVKIQRESEASFHIATVLVDAQRGAQHRYHSLVTGARISRTMIRTLLKGEGVETDLNGLYLVRDRQLADHFMTVEHASPHCVSHEHFNGILAGTARGVFHGRIRVHPGAQKTDAKQTNRNLLLSDKATADSKPQLEIYADDVKCTHGATVGQLNEEAIFYLRSRGLSFSQAKRILVHAFAGEIIERIRCEPVREELDRWIWDELESIPELSTVTDE